VVMEVLDLNHQLKHKPANEMWARSELRCVPSVPRAAMRWKPLSCDDASLSLPRLSCTGAHTKARQY
jgi:hypothetical protein